MNRYSYVYILADGCYGTLYVGVTANLVARVWQHREGVTDGHTKKHGITQLVWYEVHEEIYQAITREKQIKRWKRNWKINLIQSLNPDWRDLYADIAGS